MASIYVKPGPGGLELSKTPPTGFYFELALSHGITVYKDGEKEKLELREETILRSLIFSKPGTLKLCVEHYLSVMPSTYIDDLCDIYDIKTRDLLYERFLGGLVCYIVCAKCLDFISPSLRGILPSQESLMELLTRSAMETLDDIFVFLARMAKEQEIASCLIATASFLRIWSPLFRATDRDRDHKKEMLVSAWFNLASNLVDRSRN